MVLLEEPIGAGNPPMAQPRRQIVDAGFRLDVIPDVAPLSLRSGFV